MSETRPFKLTISERARDELSRLDKPAAERIIKKLLWLAKNAEAVGHEMLVGKWKGYYRLRVGNYRVIYIIDNEARLLDVAFIGHRRDVYDR
jgi:mRNA interferase RelE/StbE